HWVCLLSLFIAHSLHATYVCSGNRGLPCLLRSHRRRIGNALGLGGGRRCYGRSWNERQNQSGRVAQCAIPGGYVRSCVRGWVSCNLSHNRSLCQAPWCTRLLCSDSCDEQGSDCSSQKLVSPTTRYYGGL